jgi:hypothetical protein
MNMPRIEYIHDEIVQIAGCSFEDAEIIHLLLIQKFGELGPVKYSEFAHEVKKLNLIVGIKHSQN